MDKEFVSVIVPVLNVSSSITRVLDSLTNQNYPPDCYEVIIIDNGSTDDTVEKVSKYPVKLLVEDQIKNPYAARNKGMKHARGSIFALTDGNKIPARDWIEKGIRCIRQNKYDLIGGKVEFIFPPQKTVGEIFDSITFLDNARYIKEEKGSLGGNLFFKKEVFARIGNFPDNYRSGMDIYWTRKASDTGFQIGYCSEVLVFSVARKLSSTLKKSFRIGMGHPLTMRNSGKKISEILYQTVGTFSPPSQVSLKNRIETRGIPDYHKFYMKLWILDYARRIAMGTGRILGIFKLLREMPRNENDQDFN